MNKRQAKKMDKKRAKDLNNFLTYASSLRKGSDDITAQLAPLMEKLYEYDTGKKLPDGFEWNEKYNNKYFEISKDYTGKEYELFRYVTFKNLPSTKSIDQNVYKIAKNPYSTPKAYKQHRNEWAHKTYKALTTGLKENKDSIKYSHNLKYMHYLNSASDIEYIMNSSAAWNIARRAGKDSDQVLADWVELYNAVADAYMEVGDADFMDEVFNAIDHGNSLDSIVKMVDDKIIELLSL